MTIVHVCLNRRFNLFVTGWHDFYILANRVISIINTYFLSPCFINNKVRSAIYIIRDFSRNLNTLCHKDTVRNFSLFFFKCFHILSDSVIQSVLLSTTMFFLGVFFQSFHTSHLTGATVRLSHHIIHTCKVSCMKRHIFHSCV